MNKHERNLTERNQNTKRKRKRTRELIRTCILLGMVFLLVVVIYLLFGVGKWLRNEISASKESKKPIKQVTNMDEIEDSSDAEVPVTASILTGGDIILHEPFLTSDQYLKEDGNYEYDSIFKYIKPLYASADFTVLNLETTISDGNYSGYPRFKSPAEITTALRNASVDLCLLANNHIYDNGNFGFHNTMDVLSQQQLLFTGTRKDSLEPRYWVQDLNGIKVGFLNYVFETGANDGCDVSINCIPVPAGDAELLNTFAYWNLEQFYQDIQTQLANMKTEGVEYTIAYIHWGEEYKTMENDRQRSIASNLCELGIDALIGGHPHVVQPVDVLTSSDGSHQMLCAYSLGNHLSDQYKERMDSSPQGHTEDGLMIKLLLERDSDDQVILSDVSFIPTWNYMDFRTENHEYFIFPLDDPDSVVQNALAPDIRQDVIESLERTNQIIGQGVEKVKAALPFR